MRLFTAGTEKFSFFESSVAVISADFDNSQIIFASILSISISLNCFNHIVAHRIKKVNQNAKKEKILTKHSKKIKSALYRPVLQLYKKYYLPKRVIWIKTAI
jgi:hypothetical protein